MVFWILVIFGVLLGSDFAHAQKTQDTDASVQFIFNSFLFLFSSAATLLCVVGLFFVRIDASNKPEPNNDYFGDAIAILGAFVAFAMVGYGVAYIDPGSFIGSIALTDFGDREQLDVYESQYSAASDILFQSVYAALGVALVTLTLSGRTRSMWNLAVGISIAAYLWPFTVRQSWGGGFLFDMGFSDFAGSATLFAYFGIVALMMSITSGPRVHSFDIQAGRQSQGPGHPGLAAAAAFLILSGCAFGLGAGSQLALGTVADAESISRIAISVLIAGSAGGVAGGVLNKLFSYRNATTAFSHGTLAGCASVMGVPDQLSIVSAVLIGILAAIVYILLARLLDRLRIDDPIGAIAAGGGGGIFGTLIIPSVESSATLTTQILGLGIFVFSAATAGALIGLTSRRARRLREESKQPTKSARAPKL